MNWLETQPNKHPRTASRIVDGEAIIVLPEAGAVKMLNAVGSRIWELSDGSHPVHDIVEVIYQEYDVDREQAEQEDVELVLEMVHDDLLTVETVE